MATKTTRYNIISDAFKKATFGQMFYCKVAQKILSQNGWQAMTNNTRPRNLEKDGKIWLHPLSPLS